MARHALLAQPAPRIPRPKVEVLRRRRRYGTRVAIIAFPDGDIREVEAALLEPVLRRAP